MLWTTLVDPATLQPHLNADDLVVVDCRFDLGNPDAGRKAYQQQHVPGAVYADLDNDLSGPPLTDHGRHPLPSPARMRQVFGQLGIDKTKQVVAYDDKSNMMAARLWWMLNYMGHNAVAVLDGGWPAWLQWAQQQSNDALLQSGETQADVAQFSGQPIEDRLVVLDQVTDQQLMIDSRAPERYAGEFEPLDPKAGHIPGAVNFHYANSLEQGQHFKSPEVLGHQLTALLGDTDPAEATFYCGSGVSACVNLLAAAHAGLPIHKLYVGSWSEWCRK
jgi:thiosulfate/3-mercaptopyruvate sulfurtransferase